MKTNKSKPLPTWVTDPEGEVPAHIVDIFFDKFDGNFTPELLAKAAASAATLGVDPNSDKSKRQVAFVRALRAAADEGNPLAVKAAAGDMDAFYELQKQIHERFEADEAAR